VIRLLRDQLLSELCLAELMVDTSGLVTATIARMCPTCAARFQLAFAIAQQTNVMVISTFRSVP
jgi:hypothetical protein